MDASYEPCDDDGQEVKIKIGCPKPEKKDKAKKQLRSSGKPKWMTNKSDFEVRCLEAVRQKDYYPGQRDIHTRLLLIGKSLQERATFKNIEESLKHPQMPYVTEWVDSVLEWAENNNVRLEGLVTALSNRENLKKFLEITEKKEERPAYKKPAIVERKYTESEIRNVRLEISATDTID